MIYFTFYLSFQMFDQLHQTGDTSFALKLSDSCDTCYNVRLLKVIYETYWNTTHLYHKTLECTSSHPHRGGTRGTA